MSTPDRPHDPLLLGKLLLNVGMSMLHAGAPTRRVNLVLNRISGSYGYRIYADLGTRHLSVSIRDGEGTNVFSGGRSKPTLPGVNFRVVSEISNMSLALEEKQKPLAEAREQLLKIQAQPHYSRWLVLLVVSLAGSAFCYTFGGNVPEMGSAFFATFCGLFFKQELLKKGTNTYVITFLSAVMSALAIVFCWKIGVISELGHAFATSVLYLIPGIPLIIAFVDLLDGYILNGLDRGVNALIHAFAIAAGLSLILHVFNIPF
ncbi:threonine/serine exporter family protein [Algoriphagus aestuariicola]|uniref:Threonine/serine exporter family protein n=1 Tax=Algoriphagus aestuariicola TaxID=1852016 RepID=A0ABS3BXP7_9BACT|nr:threonine/serine exporter family protein [Algoriphagus aestuariicola]MBN7803115.1 threonine/serine exporter family protein [Algoriphagus aestuariicola]